MKHLLDPSSDVSGWLASQGQTAYRAKQLEEWVYQKRAVTFDDMTSLSKQLRSGLAENFRLWTTNIVRHSQSPDGTEKLLLELHDGGRIECVLLRDGIRRTICVSSQVGCAMGCVFCASGLDGVERNLTAGEILEQMLRLAALLPAEERLSHIVMMGMGEPLANLPNLLSALGQATSNKGLNISARRITISTVGLPPAIRRLADENSRYHLAVSLHAPDDELRNQLVPVNANTGLDEILDAADHYFEISRRRLTFEYVLLSGVNDHPEHARALAKLLRGRKALINVIPYNPVAGLPYATPTQEAQHEFREILQRSGLVVQYRQRKGDKINAACGQLRRSTPGPGDALLNLE